MPLDKGSSQKAFVKNLKTEMEDGKSQKQSLAIAYAMKRKAQRKKMADGGEVKPEPKSSPTPQPAPKMDSEAMKSVSDSFKSAVQSYAEGGEAGAMEEDDMEFNQKPVDMKESTEDADDDLVMRIMHKRYSKGGQVANDTGNGEIADEMPNQFDDLVLDDDLDSSYGEDDNAGDELGNKQEDEDRADLVDRIMLKSKKQKIPNGYPGR